MKKYTETKRRRLKEYWEVIKGDYFKENMREERNQLLQESDFRAVSDYPQRDKWIVYRQELRDFPSVWTPETPFPEKPE